MSLTIPVRFSDGAGNAPAAANWNDCNDWLTALALSNGLINNGGMESWSAGTTFTNPANATVLADSWTELKSGTSPCTADVTREASVIDTGTYSMKVNITGAGSSDSYWAIKQSVGSPSAFGSLTALFCARVKCATANKVRLKLYDGTTSTYSSYHPGDGTWQLLQVKAAVAAIPSEVTVTVEINPANFTDAIYVDSSVAYLVPSAISTRAQQALIFNPVLSGFLPLIGGTMSGAITFSPSTIGIVGTTTNNNASAGNVGEYLSSTISSPTNTPANGNYGDLTSISLTAGDWDISCNTQFTINTATWTNVLAGISTTTGNFSTGLTEGDNAARPGWASSSTTPTIYQVAIPSYRLSLSGSATAYLKYRASFSGGQPQAVGRISARRVR